ncbi:hypothetical protein K7432_006916 [Basidiobolus ranarum]|uniref:Uncharacterized protein n=1 Tax=Basidiobolus ranarum TaxID=34480 RepID=A0ABR2WU68_9FUNG
MTQSGPEHYHPKTIYRNHQFQRLPTIGNVRRIKTTHGDIKKNDLVLIEDALNIEEGQNFYWINKIENYNQVIGPRIRISKEELIQE